MRGLLRKKFFVDALELLYNPLDLVPRRRTLLVFQFHCFRTAEAPMGTIHNRGHHLQIADQFGGGPSRNFLLPLHFEKQRGVVQNAFADGGRTPAPSRIQLAGCACIAVMFSKDRRHPLAILQALARHRHQKLHRHLRRDLAFTHLLLDSVRQQFHQRQSARDPAHAAVESPRQFLQAVAEPLLHLGQLPAHLQRGLVFGKAQGAIQQHGGGLTHRPHDCFYRIPPELFQGGDSLIAINHHVAVGLVFSSNHHDGCLLTALCQRGQQSPLARRMAHTEMPPSPLELMKLQLHRQG